MSEGETRQRLQALEADEDLAALQRPPATFNIFEATGDTWHELRHSHLLYFLLNSRETHGLEDMFIKSLLQRVWPLDNFASTFNGPSAWTAYREYSLADDEKNEQGRVDILLLHEGQGLAVIIENKINSGEHSNQLDLYYRVLKGRGWATRGVYLTRHGLIPSHSKYVPISYVVVCAVIDEILTDQVVANDVRTLLTHYIEMVRRHIVNEQDIDAACQRIYRQHEQAIKLVQERVSARQKKIGAALESRVRQLVVDQQNIDHWEQNGSKYIRFVLQEWEKESLLYTKKWSPILTSILEFGLANSPQEVYVNLQIGPGDRNTCQSLFDMARSKQKSAGPFTVDGAVPSEYSEIYHRDLLSPQQYEELSADALVEKAKSQWAVFVEQDLPHIKDAIQQWIIETGSARRA